MRITTLYKSIKSIALLGASVFVLLNVAPVSAMNKVVEGVGLKKPLEIELDFSESDYLLVTASQSHADYTLNLKGITDRGALKTTDIAYSTYLDELLLVHKSECGLCSITVEATSALDKQSPYRVSVESLTDLALADIDLLKALTEAGQLWSQVQSAGTTEASDQTLNQVIGLLEKSLVNQAELHNHDWYYHALLLVAQTHKQLSQSDELGQTVQRILAETQFKTNKYRVNALFEHVQFVQNVSQKLDTFDELIKTATAINEVDFIPLAKIGMAVTLVNEARFSEAIDLLDNARQTLERQSKWREIPEALYNLSWAHQRAGNLPESLRYATQQRLMSEAQKDTVNIAWAMYNLAMTYGQMGEATIADDFSDRAIELLKDAAEKDVSIDHESVTAALMFQMAQISLRFGALDLASDHLAESKRNYDIIGFKAIQAGLTFVAGEISMARGDYAAARSSFLKSISVNQENDSVLLSGVFLLRLAELEMIQGNLLTAATHQSKALKILANTEDYDGLARALSQAVELLYRLGASQDAKELANRVQSLIDQYSLEQDKAKFAYRRALVAADLGLLDESADYLALATSIIELTLPKVRRKDLRQTYLGLQKSIFELNIETALKKDPQNVLWPLLAAERFKARTLKESINSIDSQSGVDEATALERDKLLKSIQAKAVLWHKHRVDENTAEPILEQTRELSLALQKLETEIEFERQTAGAVSSEVEVKGLSMPSANELVAYYFTGERQSWLWVLTVKEQAVYRLPPASDLEPLIVNMLAEISRPPVERSGSTSWSQKDAIAKLSDALLKPLVDHIESGSIDTITFVADGLMHSIPMAPLVLPGTDRPMISDFALIQSPSLTTQKSLSERANQRPQNQQLSALVVADPISSKQSELGLARLTHAADEARYIESYLGKTTTTLVSERALKADFLEQLAKPYAILHFATHGLLNSQEPALSGLVFSDVNGAENLWLAPEIRQANIKANLVVLSACESSMGKSVSGEGLFSLSRAFIEAGANQVIGTLWKVQDHATAELIDHFYKNLTSDDTTVAQALQRAQKAIYQNKNNDWSDPYYWAGFQLQGGGANQSYASTN